MSTVEMQIITAPAQLYMCVLYLVNIATLNVSFSIRSNHFPHIPRPQKIDATCLNDLSSDRCSIFLLHYRGCQKKVCDALLQHRVNVKLKGKSFTRCWAKHTRWRSPGAIHRAAGVRKPFDKNNPDRLKLEHDIEAEEGNAGIEFKSKLASLPVSYQTYIHLQRIIFCLTPNGNQILCRR